MGSITTGKLCKAVIFKSNILVIHSYKTWTIPHFLLFIVMLQDSLRDFLQRCARFPEILQHFSERQILWSLCLVVFLALTLKLPDQTSLSVAPKLTGSLGSHEKRPNFRKTSTSQDFLKSLEIPQH